MQLSVTHSNWIRSSKNIGRHYTCCSGKIFLNQIALILFACAMYSTGITPACDRASSSSCSSSDRRGWNWNCYRRRHRDDDAWSRPFASFRLCVLRRDRHFSYPPSLRSRRRRRRPMSGCRRNRRHRGRRGHPSFVPSSSDFDLFSRASFSTSSCDGVSCYRRHHPALLHLTLSCLDHPSLSLNLFKKCPILVGD